MVVIAPRVDVETSGYPVGDRGGQQVPSVWGRDDDIERAGQISDVPLITVVLRRPRHHQKSRRQNSDTE